VIALPRLDFRRLYKKVWKITSLRIIDIENTDIDINKRERLSSKPEVYAPVLGLMPLESGILLYKLLEDIFEAPFGDGNPDDFVVSACENTGGSDDDVIFLCQCLQNVRSPVAVVDVGYRSVKDLRTKLRMSVSCRQQKGNRDKKLATIHNVLPRQT